MILYRITVVCITLFVWIHSAYAEDANQTSVNDPLASVKIIGGIESKEEAWPWMVALLDSSIANDYYAQYCGGVLIDDTWVLTAAHCVEGKIAASVDVAVGAYDLNNFSGNRIAVKRIRIHPGYAKVGSRNDIALLELEQSSSQPTITLFSGESRDDTPPLMVGEWLTATGWGYADGYYPSVLRQVALPVVADSHCNDIFPSPYAPLAETQLCAGYPALTGKDVCNGDSGGPVVAMVDGGWTHIGLVSYGSTCDEYYGWYGVYTRTSAFVDFIKQYVPDAQFTSKEVIPEASPVLSWLSLLLL